MQEEQDDRCCCSKCGKPYSEKEPYVKWSFYHFINENDLCYHPHEIYYILCPECRRDVFRDCKPFTKTMQTVWTPLQ